MSRVFTAVLFLFFSSIYAQCVLKRTADKFSGEVTFRTPLLKKMVTMIEPVSFTKVLKSDGSVEGYYLSLTTYGSIPVVDGEGAVILFMDGNKADYPTEEIDVDVSSVGGVGSYQYSVFITVGESMMQIFADRLIDAFKLYVFERTLTNAERKKVSDCAKEIIAAK